MSDNWRPRQTRTERISRALMSGVPGMVQGRVAEARPVRESGREEDGTGETDTATFSSKTAPTPNDESPPYVNRIANGDLGTVLVATRSGTTSDTVVNVMVSGVVVGSVTLAAGEHMVEEIIDEVSLDYGDLITVMCSSVGGGLQGLTVQVLISE